ncbi:NADH-cytochrome b5 reductase-like [Atheta coriaria]|uniref:NADH-cytochrome b5 reductase-like n=1 Tax=Dalotia coriaria TaxID=877792 RepID=UPI0031F3E15C
MECPEYPDESECCNSGCNPCIFDVYVAQLEKYKKSQLEGSTPKENCLKELKYVPFKLINIINDSLRTNIYIFEYISEFSSDKQVFYEPGQHLLIKKQSNVDQSDFTRAYTPIPWENLAGNQFAVLIKLYDDGDMSQCIKRLKIGDETIWRGPYGDYTIDYTLNCILMIAQGTGIAPLLAIIKKVLENDECETRMKLIYCCRDFEQIHLRNEVYKLLDYWNFKYELFLSASGLDLDEIKYGEVVNAKKLEENDLKSILEQENWSQVLICGNEKFSKSIKDVIQQNSTVFVHTF